MTANEFREREHELSIGYLLVGICRVDILYVREIRFSLGYTILTCSV